MLKRLSWWGALCTALLGAAMLGWGCGGGSNDSGFSNGDDGGAGDDALGGGDDTSVVFDDSGNFGSDSTSGNMLVITPTDPVLDVTVGGAAVTQQFHAMFTGQSG